MSSSDVFVHLKRGRSETRINGVRVHFSANQCFRYKGDISEKACSRALCDDLLGRPGLAVSGNGPLLEALLEEEPSLVDHVRAVILDQPKQPDIHGIPSFSADKIPDNIETIFLSETRRYARDVEQKKFADNFNVIDADLLTEIAPQAIPQHAWTPVGHHIYPIDIPEISFEKDLDILLLDFPARNLALMPNGLASSVPV